MITGSGRCFEWQGDDLRLQVRAQPRARRNEVVGESGGQLRVRVTAAPADGKANTAVIRLLAEFLHVPASRVELTGGHKGRDKRFLVRGPVTLPAALSVASSGKNRL